LKDKFKEIGKNVLCWNTGVRFSKNLTTILQKTYGKVWLTKNLGWACDFQKILSKT